MCRSDWNRKQKSKSMKNKPKIDKISSKVRSGSPSYKTSMFVLSFFVFLMNLGSSWGVIWEPFLIKKVTPFDPGHVLCPTYAIVGLLGAVLLFFC